MVLRIVGTVCSAICVHIHFYSPLLIFSYNFHKYKQEPDDHAFTHKTVGKAELEPTLRNYHGYSLKDSEYRSELKASPFPRYTTIHVFFVFRIVITIQFKQPFLFSIF